MRSVRLRVAIVLLGFVAAFVPGAAGADGQAQPERYIVVFQNLATPQAAPAAASMARAFGGQVERVYENALKGFVITLPPAVADRLAKDRRVGLIERDGTATTAVTQSSATWGLDRIDQRKLPLSATYTYERTGSGVTAYVLDTGIRYTHAEFGGRAVQGYDAFGGNGGDCNGHGTHVAGTLGGATYGVAKGARLVSVRVLDCDGSGLWSGVIAGIDWAIGHHDSGAPAVANMSIGGDPSTALDAAIQNAISDGITFVVAAGNGNALGLAQAACNTSPARATNALTIGASDKTDRKASWSNYGNCVDWFAPGVSITSSWNSANTATNTISGTSMASPHTAGVAALYLQGSPSASPATVRSALFNDLTKGAVLSALTFNNHLLFLPTSAGTPPPPPPPGPPPPPPPPPPPGPPPPPPPPPPPGPPPPPPPPGPPPPPPPPPLPFPPPPGSCIFPPFCF